MTKRWLRLGALVSALALTLAACGSNGDSDGSSVAEGDWDEIVAAAKKEGSVMLYSSHNPTNLEDLKKAFEAEYPDISMDFVRGTDPELNPKIEVENQTKQGGADVHMVTDMGWINSAIESKTYSVELLGPEFENEAYQTETGMLGNMFALMSVAVFPMGWNTDLHPDGLKEVPDVIDPRLKGKIGILNPAGIAVYVDLYRYIEETFGADFLEDLAALEPRIYGSSLAVAQALASGEIAAAPFVNPLFTEKDAGAPVQDALPSEGWGAPWYTHVLSASKNPNAAQVLANFMASKEGQSALSRGYGATMPGVEGAFASADQLVLANSSDLTPEDVKERTEAWEKIFVK